MHKDFVSSKLLIRIASEVSNESFIGGFLCPSAVTHIPCQFGLSSGRIVQKIVAVK